MGAVNDDAKALASSEVAVEVAAGEAPVLSEEVGDCMAC